jgi:hypothetical protein
MDRATNVVFRIVSVALILIGASDAAIALTMPAPFYADIPQGLQSEKIAAQLAERRQTRLAVVVGAANYPGRDVLDNALRDMEIVSTAFSSAGFDVVLVQNPRTPADIMRPIQEIVDSGREIDYFAFYFAGHGIEFNGINYLIPTDASLRFANRLPLEAVALPDILQEMQNAGANTRFVFLDACRNNNFPLQDTGTTVRSSAIRDGLAALRAPRGIYLSYATFPGGLAADGPAGENSPYARALKRHLPTPIPFDMIMNYVVYEVEHLSEIGQRPWTEGSMPNATMLRPVVTEIDQQYLEFAVLLRIWEVHKEPTLWATYLGRWPTPLFKEQSEALVAESMAEFAGTERLGEQAEVQFPFLFYETPDMVFNLGLDNEGEVVWDIPSQRGGGSQVGQMSADDRITLPVDALEGIGQFALRSAAARREVGQRGELIFQATLPAYSAWEAERTPTVEESMEFAETYSEYAKMLEENPALRGIIDIETARVLTRLGNQYKTLVTDVPDLREASTAVELFQAGGWDDLSKDIWVDLPQEATMGGDALVYSPRDVGG